MVAEAAHPADREQRFGELVFGYLQSAENGRPADRRRLVDDNPEFAADLEQFLGDLDGVGRLTSSLRAVLPTHPGDPFVSGVLGDFRIIREVGRGGMGVVYEAEQISLNRRVALKVLPFAATMDPRQLQRFRNEAQAAACLHHPHIVPVHGVGCERGVHYYAMQLIEGQSLAQVIAEIKQEEEVHHRGTEDTEKREKTSPRSSLCSLCLCGKKSSYFRRIAEVVAQAADALEYAHSMGVVHRDIKPANLMLDNGGHLWVTDFGLAKLNSADAAMTMTGDLIGTLRYMSPEQALAKHGLVDHRTDVYSLGATLYELLTLRPAVLGDDKQELLKHIAFEEPTPLRQIDKSIPAELKTITLKALAKEPGERYATAGEFAEDLRRWLGDRAITAKPPGVREKVGKWGRRHRGVAVTAGVSSTVILLLCVVGLAINNRLVTREKEQTTAALERTKVEERRKSEQLWRALVAQARGNRLSRRAGQRFETLEIVKRATDLAHTLDLPEASFNELRNTAIGALTLPDLYLAGPWNSWPADGTALGLDFDESHARYARTDRNGKCSVRRVADDAELHSLPGLGMAALPYFSRDGRLLAVSHYREGVGSVGVQLWDLEQAPAHKIWSEDGGRSVSFHPNGQQLAVAYKDGAIGLFELPSGQQQKRLAPLNLTHEIVVALHPSEPVVAVCSYYDSGVQLRDLNTGKVLASLPQGSRPGSIAWHPDGRTLAVGLMEGALIRLYDRATLEVFREIKLDQTASSLNFNHAGDRLVSTGWGGISELVDVDTGTKLHSTTNVLHGRRFSRDDRRLAGAIQDGKLGIWDVADGRECRTLVRDNMPENAGYTHRMSVSPDGRILAAAMTDGFGIWDLARGDHLEFIPAGASVGVLFEASGSLLVLCQTGLFRWPLAKESSATGQRVMGPPERLPLPCGGNLGQSRDGRVIVTCARSINFERPHAGGWILHADRPDSPIRLDQGADMTYITVSPDGRWVVTVNQHPAGLTRVWDARDGSPIKEFAGRGSGCPQFSPDGNWLYTGLDGGRLVAVRDWEPGPKVSGTGTFSPDSKLLAVATSAGDIRLVEPSSGREVATLEVPSQDWASVPFFTPDGTKLIAHSGRKVQGIRVWDLRLIRQQLAEMDLDWHAPPFPPVDPRNTVVPLTIEVRLGDLALAREHKAKQDIERLSRSLEKIPDDAETCNDLAWVYLTAPEALRNVNVAVPLAEKAVRLKPGNWDYATTLSVAFYRRGRYREAVEIIDRNLAHAKDRDLACDLYLLAMSHHKLGETARARVYYDWAVRWPRTDQRLTPEVLEDLDMFRSEARELLGIADKNGVEIAQPPGVKK